MSYSREDLLDFLTALDEELSKKTTLIVIGGASLTLAYHFGNMTIDVDVISKITAELSEAIEKAKAKVQLDMRISATMVYAEILNMGNRFRVLDEIPLKNLVIMVPEKHDLALMKCARSEARDIEDIKNLHQSDALDAEILLNRFRNEMLPLNSGDDELLKLRFLDMVEVLFGEDLADKYEGLL